MGCDDLFVSSHQVHFERWAPHQTGFVGNMLASNLLYSFVTLVLRGTVEIHEKGEEVFVIEGSFSDELGVHRSWSWCRSL